MLISRCISQVIHALTVCPKQGYLRINCLPIYALTVCPISLQDRYTKHFRSPHIVTCSYIPVVSHNEYVENLTA